MAGIIPSWDQKDQAVPLIFNELLSHSDAGTGPAPHSPLLQNHPCDARGPTHWVRPRGCCHQHLLCNCKGGHFVIPGVRGFRVQEGSQYRGHGHGLPWAQRQARFPNARHGKHGKPAGKGDTQAARRSLRA